MKNLKTLALVIICLQLPILSPAQSILIDGVTWHYTLSNWWYPQQESYNRFEINGDSTILNKTCKILNRSAATCDLRSEREFIYEEEDKLYYYDRFNDQFNLLYDYGASVGDILEIPYWDSEMPNLEFDDDVFYILITAIENVDFSGKILKKFTVSYDFIDDNDIKFGTQEGTIIEGIGSMANLFHLIGNGFCDGLFNIVLRCFTHPEYGTMNFVDHSCTATFGPDATDDIQVLQNNFNISPNPFANTINLTSKISVQNGDVQIYDLMGRKVYSEAINISRDQQITIDCATLISNIYLLKIVDKTGQVLALEKIVKF